MVANAPATATLRITGGCLVKVEAHIVRSRDFQLMTEKARATPDVVTGMYLLFYFVAFPI